MKGTRILRRFAPFLLFIALGVQGASSLDYFAEGERLFRLNKPADAIPMLFQASQMNGTDPRVFIYLGLCYQQTGKYSDAISTFMKGTSAPGTDRKALFFNAGNVYYAQQLYAEADAMFTRSVGLDSAYAPAYLNRANARVQLAKFSEAADDYRTYLVLDPATWQSDSIRQLIDLLSREIALRKDEEAKLAAAQAAEEAEKAAAAERYQRLLDEVSSSLQSVTDASTLSAGSETIMDYDEEGQLE